MFASKELKQTVALRVTCIPILNENSENGCVWIAIENWYAL